MSFRDNLQHLRGTRDLSQAQLATLLGVSASPWQNGKREKLPRDGQAHQAVRPVRVLARRLVRGDLTGCATASEAIVEAEPASAAMPVDKDGYDEHMRRRAWDVAASVR